MNSSGQGFEDRCRFGSCCPKLVSIELQLGLASLNLLIMATIRVRHFFNNCKIRVLAFILCGSCAAVLSSQEIFEAHA